MTTSFWNGWQKSAQRDTKIDIKNRQFKTSYTFALLERIRRVQLLKVLGDKEVDAE